MTNDPNGKRVLHTGEVVGSIPTAPTTETADLTGFLASPPERPDTVRDGTAREHDRRDRGKSGDCVPDLVARLRSSEPLPACPYDRLSPHYRTAPTDKPCAVCGGLNDPDAPDLCRGADTRIMGEAADAIERLREQVLQLQHQVISIGYINGLKAEQDPDIHKIFCDVIRSMARAGNS